MTLLLSYLVEYSLEHLFKLFIFKLNYFKFFDTKKKMSGLKRFFVELAKAPHVYTPGEPVIGRLHVLSEENLMINSISIELKGEAFVTWYSLLCYCCVASYV